LLEELPSVRVLLSKLEMERNRPPKDVERIFRLALEHPGRTHMDAWSATHGALAPHSSPAGAGETGMRQGEKR
jgi:hypothetical protein